MTLEYKVLSDDFLHEHESDKDLTQPSGAILISGIGRVTQEFYSITVVLAIENDFSIVIPVSERSNAPGNIGDSSCAIRHMDHRFDPRMDCRKSRH